MDPESIYWRSVSASVIDYSNDECVGTLATPDLIAASKAEPSGTGVVPAIEVEGVWTLADASDNESVGVYIENAP